jgi:hypothetical protein
MTALFTKLNYKGQSAVLCLNAPESMEPELALLGQQVPVFREVSALPKIEFALVFVTNSAQIEGSIAAIYDHLEGDAVLWYCYPKASSKRYQSAVNRDHGWEPLGQRELEPVRQVAIDTDWSALRFRKTAFIKTMKRNFAISETGKQKVDLATKNQKP